MKRIIFFVALCCALTGWAQRERISLDKGWSFAYGDASSPAADFGCGTEYFNYLTKAASIHNEGPYSPKFDPSKWDKEWRQIDLPHDWVVDLPFAPEASHSHGYKTVGHKYPQTSVGWYRRTFFIPESDKGRHISLQFDGIFRDSRVWVNGFYLGGEPDGYATQVYDISEYLNYGGDNLVTVRADATLEQGWFYEGAGIYRHVWLDKTAPLHVAPFGVFAYTKPSEPPYGSATLAVETTVKNYDTRPRTFSLSHTLLDADGRSVTSLDRTGALLRGKDEATVDIELTVAQPRLWSPADPYLYTLRTDVCEGGEVVDSYLTPVGIRYAVFDPDRGFLLNGEPLKLKGVNMHQDHAGVGSAIPDGLQAYRLHQLKKLGCNAYRSSHNPMSPAMLDACDSIGILVIDENRLTGVNTEHIRQLQSMIRRDRSHPCVILWSVGNEEWGIEWNEFGERLVESMREYAHLADPSRPVTVASSSGPTVLVPADVAGYNYILQNPVDQHRADYPRRCALGSEETSGCGTRGLYYPDHVNGRMVAINRAPSGPDSLLNAIERGWRFYDERPWLAGLFYWTGFDYRGEPNPMVYPATGSEFGILDYCGFPKDEAYYLRSWWTDEPVLHIFPHWNLHGHEGEPVSVWAYSNLDEVELYVNGRSLGRKAMPRDGHLEWDAVYQPGTLRAVGYKAGRKALERRISTTGAPARVALTVEYTAPDITVVRAEVLDSKGRLVPDACVPVSIELGGDARIIGVGNGDPAFRDIERPTDPAATAFTLRTFNGLAQILLSAPVPLTAKINE